MRCVTESEITEWLRERSIPKDPYHGDAAPRHYLQFYAPSTYQQQDALARHYYERIIPDSDSLIHMTDWSLYQQSEMIAIAGIRSSRGEDRMLIDSPGHTLMPSEKEIGISLFALSASFAWSSYVYSSLYRSTLYNWEGEIFDFWTDSAETVSEVKLILKQFDLSETNQGEQCAAPNRLTRSESDFSDD
ncbi:hypothetical protein [Rubritalea marina]|uniref:hypothetical protein n=1 Tax=Rubritalea marina TaxID=361055 RepID=UPI00035E1D95|nr:hypothetical protein [Rubritalea marina]